MRSRRAQWTFILLAVITNFGGGPMAWAHLAGSGHCHTSPAPVMEMPAGCADHQTAHHAPDSRPSNPLPCCDGGSCACAAPPAPLTMSLIAPTDLRHDTVLATLVYRDAAPVPSDDTLRPPIR